MRQNETPAQFCQKLDGDGQDMRNPLGYCTANSEEKQAIIYSLLQPGQANALSRASLVALTGLSHREVRRQIARERRQGLLILSSVEGDGGYYKPGNRRELERFVKSMDARARATFAAVTAARRLLREMEAEDEQESTRST